MVDRGSELELKYPERILVDRNSEFDQKIGKGDWIAKPQMEKRDYRERVMD